MRILMLSIIGILIVSGCIGYKVDYREMFDGKDPCGILVISVDENGPFEKAGISAGETILDVSSSSSSTYTFMPYILQDFISELDIGDNIEILTDSGYYNVTIGEKDGEPYIGLVANVSLCICGDGICEKGEKYSDRKVTTRINCNKDC